MLLFISLGSYCKAQTSTGEQTKKGTVAKIKVFPNPATNVINILGLIDSAKAEISISDMYGHVAQQHHWEIRDNSLSIPIPSLNSGIYVITIISEEQSVRTKFYKK